MKRIPKTSFLVKVLLSLYFLMLLSLGAQSQNTFLYTNDNVTENTVTALTVNSDDSLTVVGTFLTGGSGTTSCALWASNRVAVSNSRHLLFASNDGSNDVSVFSINTGNGSLSFIGRFPTGGLAGDCSTNGTTGISLAVTPDDTFLMAGNAGSNDVTVFAIGSDGSLTAVSGSPFAAGGPPDGTKISPNGSYLGSGFVSAGVGVLSIAHNGPLALVPGSPFPGSGSDAGVDIKCSGNQLFAGNATANGGTTIVDAYRLAGSGTLSPIPGSPFEPGVGVDSNVVLVSPHGQFLFVSNQGSNTGDDTITVFKVAANGNLTLVPGSPFHVNSNNATPSIMATNQSGTLLFVADSPFTNDLRHSFTSGHNVSGGSSLLPSIAVFQVGTDGSLTEVGTPTQLSSSGLQAIAIYPAPVCTTPVPQIQQPLVPDSVEPGGSEFTLTVNGTGFVSDSVVKWNGAALSTTVVNDNQVTATVPAGNIAVADTASVTVSSRALGGVSNALPFTITNPTPSVSFGTQTFTVGLTPANIVQADFNHDGKIDLAIVNLAQPDDCYINGGAGTISILLGNGEGTFSNGATLCFSDVLALLGFSSLAVGDFDGDGNVDIAASFASMNAVGVQIFYGSGDGTFAEGAPFASFETIGPMVVADFDGDGNLDLAIPHLSSASSGIQIFLGDGNGGFRAGVDVGPLNWSSLTVGDFNYDGIPDLAVAGTDNAGRVEILLGRGDGNFAPASSQPATNLVAPNSVLAGDFNGDGILDLAFADSGSDSLAILLGHGDGTFTQLMGQPTMVQPSTFIGAADLNGNGRLDLAAICVNSDCAPSISTFLGNNGTFDSGPTFQVGNRPAAFAFGDFNGDGRLDVAVVNSADNTVSILLQSPVAGVDPPALDFGNQTVNTTSSPITVQLSNTGTANLNISGISISGANDSDFSQTHDCPASLPFTPPGNTCTIQVTFTPSTTGPRQATLSIADNAAGSPQTVSLSGMGISTQLPPTCTPLIQNTGLSTIFVTANCTSAGTIVSTTIDWGDGSPPTVGTSGTHTYIVDPDNGLTVTVTVTATDNLNQVGMASQLVSFTPAAKSVFPGQDTTVVFTPPPGTLTYSCPSGIGPNGPISDLRTVGITCTGSQPVQNGQVTLTIHTTGTGLARLERRSAPLSRALAFWMPFPAIVLLGSGLTRRRTSRNHLRRYVTFGLLLVLLLISTSCGGGFTVPTQPPPSGPVTDAGIYYLTATGTDSTGFVQISLIVPLNVASN